MLTLVKNTILLTAPLWWRQRRALAFQRWRGPSSRAQRWIVSLVAFVVLPIIIESSGLFNDLVRCSCVSLTADFIHAKSVIQQAPHTGHCVYGPGHCMLQSTTRGHAGMLGVAVSPPPAECRLWTCFVLHHRHHWDKAVVSEFLVTNIVSVVRRL